jgi:hypothetical protein
VGVWFGIKGRYPQEFKLEQVNDDFYSAIKEGKSNNSIKGTPNTLSRLQ